jgi:hypothetical protein
MTPCSPVIRYLPFGGTGYIHLYSTYHNRKVYSLQNFTLLTALSPQTLSQSHFLRYTWVTLGDILPPGNTNVASAAITSCRQAVNPLAWLPHYSKPAHSHPFLLRFRLKCSNAFLISPEADTCPAHIVACTCFYSNSLKEAYAISMLSVCLWLLSF